MARPTPTGRENEIFWALRRRGTSIWHSERKLCVKYTSWLGMKFEPQNISSCMIVLSGENYNNPNEAAISRQDSNVYAYRDDRSYQLGWGRLSTSALQYRVLPFEETIVRSDVLEICPYLRKRSGGQLRWPVNIQNLATEAMTRCTRFQERARHFLKWWENCSPSTQQMPYSERIYSSFSCFSCVSYF